MRQPTKKREAIQREVLAALRQILPDLGASKSESESNREDEDLMQRGVMDSIGMIGMVIKIEERFKIKLPIGDFDPWNFNTLRAITELVADRIAMAADP